MQAGYSSTTHVVAATAHLRVMLAALLLLLCAACAPVPVAPQPPEATVTPLANTMQTVARAPTSTPAPTVVAINALPEVREARQLLAEGQYERALGLLRRAATSNPANPAIQEELAAGYLTWGQALVDASNGDLPQISAALERFSNGLAAAPPQGAARPGLQAEYNLARALLDAAASLDRLPGVINTQTDPAVQRAAADSTLEQFAQLAQQRADYPGLAILYARALVVAAEVYAQAPGPVSERLPLLNRARDYCQRALALDQQNEAARRCDQRVSEQLVQLTATPRPRLRIVKKTDGRDTPDCVSMQITGTNVAGWRFTIDGANTQPGIFDGAGNARICGIPTNQDFTMTVVDANGRLVPGGSAPVRGGDILVATWR